MTEEAAGGEVVRVGEAMGGAAEHEAPTDNSDTTPYHREIAALPQ